MNQGKQLELDLKLSLDEILTSPPEILSKVKWFNVREDGYLMKIYGNTEKNLDEVLRHLKTRFVA